MKDIPRYFLYVVIAILAVLLVQQWEKQYPAAKAVPQTQAQQQQMQHNAEKAATLGGFVPGGFKEEAKQPVVAAEHVKKQTLSVKSKASQLIWVETDVMRAGIDSKTGQVVSTQLLKFPISIEEKHTPITLLTLQPEQLYLAQSGITSSTGYQATAFNAARSNYSLQTGQDSVQVVLQGKTKNGLTVNKVYTFHRNDYAVSMKTTIKNTSRKTWTGNLYTQLLRQPPKEKSKGMFGMHFYLGASTSSPKTPYEKIPFKSMRKQMLSRTTTGAWVAMQQHYFLSAWIPGNLDEQHHVYTHYTPENIHRPASYVVGYLSPELTVKPGQSADSTSTLYVGPETYKRLTVLAPGLNHTIDYGFLWPISIAIQWLMSLIVTVIPNWGVAIILATILIKLLFYWFSSKSFISMARMKELQPRIKALKDRFADDKVGLQKATMALYKEKKVNPLGGCLPMLIQIPVFIALYWVITQSVDFRQAPFIFWIHDLSVPDPYYVLPVLMMFTMILQQWLSPTSADPAQAKMMMIMPVLFAFFFRSFPAGLVLYWCVNNLVQALQQWYVMNRYKAGKYKHLDRKKKRSRTSK
jgi:YidC/Oxa1 family membrane protein insertase